MLVNISRNVSGVKLNEIVASLGFRDDIRISYPYALHDAYLPTVNRAPQHSLAAHGTIVASQVLLEASEVDLHLVKVLNEHGYGSLDVWMQAMVDAYHTHSEGMPMIFNSSLEEVVLCGDHVNFATPIKNLLVCIAEKGIIQVAAADNSSADLLTPRCQPLPGRSPSVIGVGASAGNQVGGYLSCYK